MPGRKNGLQHKYRYVCARMPCKKGKHRGYVTGRAERGRRGALISHSTGTEREGKV